MPRKTKASDHPIPGEIWIAAPKGLISVSDQGRAMTMNGNLISPSMARGRVRWSYGVRGKSYQVTAGSLVAEMFLGGCAGDPVVHLNGDLTDLSAANLQIPWTKEQDDIIRAADNIARAAAELGMSHSAVKRRAHRIGKAWPRQWTYTYNTPLEDRLDAAIRAIAILEKAGVADRDINLALGIPKRPLRSVAASAIDACLPALFEHMSAKEIAEALGWKHAPSITNRLRKLGLVPPSTYQGKTKRGRVDEIEGEEWRLFEPGVWVSSMGRVATKAGLLSVQVRPNQTPFVLLQGGGKSRSTGVAAMMLAAFRPRLTYSRDVFLNGDFQDIRLANIVGAVDAQAAAVEIRKRVYSSFSAVEREEIIQAGVLAMMEGRALTYTAALKLGVEELHEISGQFKHTSLDEEGPHGKTGLDRLADGADLGFETGRKVNSNRWT